MCIKGALTVYGESSLLKVFTVIKKVYSQYNS